MEILIADGTVVDHTLFKCWHCLQTTPIALAVNRDDLRAAMEYSFGPEAFADLAGETYVCLVCSWQANLIRLEK